MSAFQFTVHDTPITEKEAAAILEAIGTVDQTKPTLDIAKMYRLKKMPAEALMQKAVETDSPALMSAILKLTKAGMVTTKKDLEEKAKTTRKYTRVASTDPSKLPNYIQPGDRSEENLKLVFTSWPAESRRRIGVGCVLFALSTAPEGTGMSLKEIATICVNKLIVGSFNLKSSYLDGFAYVNGSHQIVSERNFMAGKLYSAIRQATVWLAGHSVVTVTTEQVRLALDMPTGMGAQRYVVSSTSQSRALANDTSFMGDLLVEACREF